MTCFIGTTEQVAIDILPSFSSSHPLLTPSFPQETTPTPSSSRPIAPSPIHPPCSSLYLLSRTCRRSRPRREEGVDGAFGLSSWEMERKSEREQEGEKGGRSLGSKQARRCGRTRTSASGSKGKCAHTMLNSNNHLNHRIGEKRVNIQFQNLIPSTHHLETRKQTKSKLTFPPMQNRM